MTTEKKDRLVTRQRCFWMGVLLLVGLQQYPGLWGSKTLVLDFLPMALFYQVVVSLVAVVVWWIGTIVAWPDDAREPPPVESTSAGVPQATEDQV